MSSWNIILGFTTFLGFGLAIVFMILYLKNRNNDPSVENGTILINFAPHRTGGHALGTIIQCDSPTSNPRSEVIKFIPRDKSIAPDGKVRGQREALLTVKKDKIINLPIGQLSDYRNFMIALPKDATDLPKDFLDTPIGQAILWRIESINVMQSVIDSIKESNKSKAEVIRELSSDELISDLMAKQRSAIQTMATKIVEDKIEEKKKESEKIPR